METLYDSIVARKELLSALSLSLLIFARLIFAIFFTPFFGGRQIFNRIKMGTAMVMVILLYPAVSRTLPEPLPLNVGLLMLLFVKEAFIGFVLAMTISMMFYGIQAAGQFIDNQRGISIAAIFNPALGQQASLTGNFLFQLSVVIFFIAGGHRIYISGFFESFEIFPVVMFPAITPSIEDPTLQRVIRITGDVIRICIQISAPVMISLFLVEMVLGIANRVAPQMDVLFISYTLKAMAGLIIVFFALHLMIFQFRLLFRDYLKEVLEYVRVLPGF